MNRILVLLLLVILLPSCSILRRFSATSSSSNVDSRPDKSRIQSASERERMALSYYNTARAYEVDYYNTKNNNSARIALNRFEEYYVLNPTGTYAALALLRKAELYFNLKDYEYYRFELQRVKYRPEFVYKYKEEIEAIENLAR